MDERPWQLPADLHADVFAVTDCSHPEPVRQLPTWRYNPMTGAC